MAHSGAGGRFPSAAAICWKVAPLIQRDRAFCSFSRAWSCAGRDERSPPPLGHDGLQRERPSTISILRFAASRSLPKSTMLGSPRC